MFRRNFLKSALAFVGVGAIESPIKAISKENVLPELKNYLPPSFELLYLRNQYSINIPCDAGTVKAESYYICKAGNSKIEVLTKIYQEIYKDCVELEQASQQYSPTKKIVYICDDICISEEANFCGLARLIMVCYSEKSPNITSVLANV